jgi:hypothetical protein
MKSFFAAQGAEPLVTSPKQFSEMPERNLANWAKASIPYILWFMPNPACHSFLRSR